MKETIFLAGGGSAQDSQELDAAFIEEMRARDLSSIAYIPIADKEPKYEEDLRWFKSIFEQETNEIEMWIDLSEKSLEDLRAVGCIYIGGGNTYHLLKKIQDAQITKALLSFIRDGGLVYGGSAGAIILGQDIRTAPEVPKTTTVEHEGLGLFGNYSIACHYTIKSQAHFQDLSRHIKSPIIALPEKGGIRLSGRMFDVLGTESTFLITADSCTQLLPNTSFEIGK